jgi:NAD dependent epimerase/dehydratase family enzyme
MAAKHHILLLGGTGLCGLIFTRVALEAGHSLTLYIRNPAKLPAEVAENENVNIIQGELGDEDGLKRAVGCSADVFVCLAGPTLGRKEGTVSSSSSLPSLVPARRVCNMLTRVMITMDTAHHQRFEKALSAPHLG